MSALDQALEGPIGRGRTGRAVRRRGPWIASGVLLVLVVAVGLGAAVFQFGLPWWVGEGDRRYQVYLPPQYDGATRAAGDLAIHGCGMSGYRGIP